jgi:hypothetical protein
MFTFNKHKKVGSNWPTLVQTSKCHDYAQNPLCDNKKRMARLA